MVDESGKFLAIELERQERWVKLAAQFSLSCMSNTKWRKVLTAIDASGIENMRCEYKCIDSDFINLAGRPPRAHELMERGFFDGSFKPFEYKWLEWIRFPRSFQPIQNVGYVIQQDVERLKEVISRAAHASMMLDDKYLWLFGFRGPISNEVS